MTVNLSQSTVLVMYKKPIPLDFTMYKTKIRQVGFSLQGVEIETFGKIEKEGDRYAFVIEGSGQRIATRLNPVAKTAIESGEGRLWVRGRVHGWKTEGGKAHIIFSDVRKPFEAGGAE